MKKIYLLALVLISFSTRAQYFQHLYGDLNPTWFNYVHGVNTRNINYGHLFVSNMFPSSAGPEGINLVLTDENGNPIFNNVYSVQKNGYDLGGYENHVFEWDNAPNIGVVSYLYSPGGVFRSIGYLQIDQTGNVFGVHEYLPNPSSSGIVFSMGFVSNIAESADGKFLYITGSVASNTLAPGTETYVIKIEIATGNIIWSNIYEFGFTNASGGSVQYARDIIESPYMPSGAPEVVIIGEYQDVNPGTHTDQEAFFFRINANNGSPIANVTRFGLPAGTPPHTDIFRAITVSNSTAGLGLPPWSDIPTGGVGFVIAGDSYGDISVNSLGNAWVLKVDPTGSFILWTKRFQSSLYSENCYDVMERFSVANNAYEYYVLGSTGASSRDVMVLKMDDWGIPVPNGEFRYDGYDESVGYRLDQFNNAGPNSLNSLNIYANTQTVPLTGDSKMLRINAYFDGTVDCNELISTPSITTGPGLLGSTTVSVLSDFSMGTTLPVNVRSTIDQNICFHQTIPWGNNARVAPAEPKGDKEAVVSPNPMQQGSPVAMVEVESNEPTTVQVAIYDMLGKQYAAGSYTLAKGKNQLPVDLSTANMAAGMYTVKVSGTAINQNILLMVK